MIKNYLTTTLRNLLRHRGYSFLNIAGLTLGLACCLLIFQYVAYEYSFDTFNTNASDLYRVTLTSSRGGDAPYTQAMSGYAMGPALAEAVPEVVHVTRLHADFGNAVVSNPQHPDKTFEEEGVYFADPAFLQMFSYPLVAGDPARALAEPGTLLLSESAATKYFGKEDPLGQTLNVTGWIRGAFRVSGVVRDVPPTSHLQFDVLLPMADLLERSGYSDPTTGWTWTNFNTYVQLRAGADLEEVEQKFTQVLLQYRGEDYKETRTAVHLSVQPLRDIHLNAEIFAPKVVMSSYRTVYFFTLIGLVTLLIALINYVNLATARALDRAREVGVRKVVGAHRGQLITQFLTESALTNLAAFVFAVALATTLTPLVNSLAGTQLTDALWSSPWLWGAFLGTFCAGTLLAGLYPAFVLSAFRPVAVLKGRAGSFATGLWLRRGLVILQFGASIVLVSGTAIVYNQLTYMRHMDLGLELGQVLMVHGPRVLPEGLDVASAMQPFMQELKRLPAVRQVASSSTVPGQGFNWYTSGVRQATADPAANVSGVVTWIDTSFARLYGLEAVAGEKFQNIPLPAPEGEPMPVMANESAVLAVGFEAPAEALDQVVILGGRQGRIVGVFRDFNWSSAHEARENIFFALSTGERQISLKVQTNDLSLTVAAVEKIYTRLFPGNPFRYAFVDEQFDQQYRNDQRFATLFGLFAGLAILIACLGLYGLATFTARQRIKEIGIRKVLGASVHGLVGLLSRDFLTLVIASVVIALPVAYLVMNRWLDGFAYRTEVGPGIFLVTGALVLLIALGTVSYQAIKAALADPVKSLRYE